MSEKAGEIISIIFLIFYATMAGIVGVAIFIDALRRILKCSKNKYLKSETAKEILYKLKETLILNNEENTEIFDYVLTLETIDEIAKQYEVEE